MHRHLLIMGIFAALTACNSSSIVGPKDLVAFARAKALWESRPFADYTYEIRTFCFCPPELTQWTRVVVQGGRVTHAEPAEANPAYPLTTTIYFQPIDSLFSQLQRAMTEGGFSSTYADIVVAYDKDLGFPQLIEYLASPFVADAGATIEIKAVSSFNTPDQSLRRR